MSGVAVELRSQAALDAPFAAAYAAAASAGRRRATSTPVAEYGFAGMCESADTRVTAPVVSAWIPGDRAAERMDELRRWQAEGRAFRWLFPERYHAPSIEARELLQRRDIGRPVQLLVTVQTHPERLLTPARMGEENAWLREPILNRLPLMTWMMGPVTDVRILSATQGENRTGLVLLRHRRRPCLSSLQFSVSADLREGGAPAVRDAFECIGGDGYLRVNGIWAEAVGQPRLEVHRGAMELVRRDLPRTLEQVYRRAATEPLPPQCGKSYRLAGAYLDACRRVSG